MIKRKTKSIKVFYLIGIVIVLFVLIFFQKNIIKSREKRILENSIAKIQLTKGREINRWQQEKSLTLGKPIYEKIRVGYEPINNYSKQEVYGEIVAILEKNNWQRDSGNNSPDSFVGSLHQGNYLLFTIVMILPDKNEVTVFIDVQ